MDGELPPWNKHGSHNSRVTYDTAGERQEVGHFIFVHYDKVMTEESYCERAEEFSHSTWLQTKPTEHDVIGESFAAGEPMTPLSSCMSGAFKALLPDYHGASSAMLTNSDKYSYSPDNHCLNKPGTAVDEKIAVEKREESNFLKDPLGEALASATHMLPLRCAQYVTHEKNREVDQGNGNWTSVIKDALEMSNGMEMEQTLSMDERGPLMDYNPIYKGPDTAANFRLKDHYQIAGSKENEKVDGQGVKEESDSFISMLSGDISKNKDVLEMGKHEEPCILDVGSCLGKEERGITGIREHEPGLLPGFNKSSYTPFPLSERLVKSEQSPLDNQSTDHTIQGTTQQCELSCKDGSPKKTASINTGFKGAEVNVSETSVIKQNAAYLPNSQYFGRKKQVSDLVPTPAPVGSQHTAVVERENLKLGIPTEESISENSLPVPGKIETNDFQETSINTKAELSQKVETKYSPEIQNSSSVSETVPDLPVVSNRIHTDSKCKGSQFEPVESGKLNELCFQESNSKNGTLSLTSTSVITQRTADECDIHVQEKQTPISISMVLPPFNENVKNSERSEKVLLNITSESSIPPSTENVQEAPPSPTSRTDSSSQHNLQKTLLRHKKARKRKQSELEALKGPIHKSGKRHDCSMDGSETLDSTVKLDTKGCEKASKNMLSVDHDNTTPKEEDLITNGDVNPPAPRKKCQFAKPEPLADTAKTSQKPDYSCSEASQEEVLSNARINRKVVSKKKLKKKTRLCLKAKNSATLGNQCSSQSTVLSPEEDCTSHFQVGDTATMKGLSNPAVMEHSISSLESIPKNIQKFRKKTTKQTLQSKDDPHKDVPTTFSEVEADMAVKGEQKISKGKNKNASLLNRQSSQDSEGQIESMSTSVTESLKILSPQNNPKKSKQKKRAHINKSAKTPDVCPQEDMENMMTPKSKSPLKKAARTDDNETTLLDTQTSTATAKQPDSVSNVGNEVKSAVNLSTPRKSHKNKFSHIKCEAIHVPAVDQTTAQQSVLNPLVESDVSIVQPTTKRVKTRRKLNKKVSDNTVGEKCEPNRMTLSSVDSVYATETDYSGVSQQNTEKTSSRRRKTDVKFIETQSSTTSKQDYVTLPSSEDFSSIVVSNPEEAKKFSRNKTNDKHLNGNLVEETSLPAADQTMQEEIHPFDSATEMDNSDVLKQKKTKVKMKKRSKKATKCKTHITQAISDIKEQSTVQQEYSVSNKKNSRSEDMKCKKKRTSALKVKNGQPEDVADHSTVLSPLLPPPVAQSKDATQDPCIKTDNVNETVESHAENQVSITTKDVASPQSSLKKAKKTQKKLLLESKEEKEQSNIPELIHRDGKMSDLPPVVIGVASENFETVSFDQHLKVAKKSKKSMEISEAHGVSLSQEKNTGSDEAGVMVTFTQVAGLCKPSDSQIVESQQPGKDDAVVDQKDLKATKPPKKRGRKPGRKKRKIGCLLIQSIKEEPHEDICYDNRIACDFQNNTQIQTSEISQRTTDNPEEPVLKSRKSTQTQKINSGPVVENLLTQGKNTVSVDITECHTTLGETLSSSTQTPDCEYQYTVEKKPRRRGRPPSKKSKKQKLFVAHLENNTSPSDQISDLSPCQDSTENTAKAAASPINQKDIDENVIVTKQLGTDPLESLQSANDLLSHSIPMKLCEKNAIQDGSVLADINIENKATIKVLRGRKRGRKRRKIKDGQLQRLKTQDCCEPAIGLLTEFSVTSKCPTEDQNNIDSPEKNDIEKTNLDHVERIPPITAETCKITPKTDILCSSPSDLSSCLMREVKKCKVEEHSAEPNRKDSFEVSVQSYTDNTRVSRGICNLISRNVVKKESEQISSDTKIKPKIELKCTQEADELSMETSGKYVLDNPPQTENALQPSTEWKDDNFTQGSENCAVMPDKVTNNKTIRFKPKETVKKPLTCKYCGVSFRHITAYTIHQRVHTGDKPYKCKICGKAFSQLSKLKSHHNVHKQDTSYPCPCCSRRFFQKDDLLCHFKVHLQESKPNSEPQMHIKSKRSTSSKVSSETSKNYVCLICQKHFVNHDKLQDHMQVHEAEKLLTCKDCGKTFLKESSLVAHEKTHWPVKPYACSICGKGFNQLKALKKHSQDHAGETPFSCFHCGHGFSALSALRVHQASKTCIARRNDEATSNIEGFIVSQGVDGQVNTPVFFKCQICKQLFRKWCQYTLHIQTHTSSPPYICFSCGQCYEKDSEMNVHCEVCCQSSGEEKICSASLAEILQGVTQAYPLKCTSSQSLPSTGFQLNSQTPTSSEKLPQLPHSMDVEPKQTRDTDLSKPPKTYSAHSPIKLPNAQSLARSDVNYTSPSNSLECIEITQSIWKFKCSRCGQRFERYRDLSAHLQMHAPGFRYSCAHCGQFFERWSKLWLHQQRHRLKSRCYSCTQCNLQFRFLSSFREHMIDHAGQRPYACPLCPKTFIQEASLHAHQCESHKLYKSLKCDVCSKTFSSLTNLIKHSLLHNGSTSHMCLLCSLSFTNTRVLKEHLKTHNTHHGPALPDIPSKPLDFPHKCKRCKASFSTGDLLYAHQIRHSRDAKTHIRPAVVPTSKLSDSRGNDTPSTPPSTRRNHISNLKLDGISNDDSLYVYSHPDKLYVSPSRRVQLSVINLDPDEPNEVSDSQNPGPELPNSEIPSQSDTHLPQATSDQETTNLNSSESMKLMANGQHNNSLNCPTFVETSVDMEVETPAQEQESEESFECADCTEKLTSVLGLYEHYILHAMGDAYVQVH